MIRMGVLGFWWMPALAFVACSSSPSASQSLSDDDDAGGDVSIDGGVSASSDGGHKTSADAGSQAHDGGVATDAGSIGGGWTIEPFDNPEELQIESIVAHPTAARNLLLGFSSASSNVVLAEWIDGTIGASFTGASGDSASPVTYVGDGSAYAIDLSPSNGGSSLLHLTTTASGRAFSGLSFGSLGARPPQAPFGPWPPRVFAGSRSSSRFLASANQTFIDLTPASPAPATWPENDLPFANTAETAMMIDWFAIDPTSDTHVLVGMHPETSENATTPSVASCTLANPFSGTVTCDAVAVDQGLPSAEAQVGGWVVASSPSHVYVETNTSAEVAKLYRSDDSGAHFSAVSVPSLGGLRGTLSVDPADYETAVYCAGGDGIQGQVYVTRDAAATWTSVPVSLDLEFACGAFDAAGSYFAGYGANLVSQKF